MACVISSPLSTNQFSFICIAYELRRNIIYKKSLTLTVQFTSTLTPPNLAHFNKNPHLTLVYEAPLVKNLVSDTFSMKTAKLEQT